MLVSALIIFWLWVAFSSDDLTKGALEFLKAYAEKNAFLTASIFFILMALAVILGPFTAVPLVPFGILMWGEFGTFMLMLGGWLAGGIATYFLGKTLGYPLIAKILSPEDLETWRGFVHKKVNFLTAFLFRLAMPAETGYIFGLSEYGFWRYLLIIFLSELPLAAATIWAGNALIARNSTLFIGWIIIIVAMITLAGYLLKKRIKRDN